MSSDTSPWGLHPFSNQKEIRLQWEQLRIRIVKRGSDLLLVENRDGSHSGIQLGAYPESDFRRYAFQSPVESIHVQPRTPDRPLVVQPIHPLRLAPRAKVEFYVSITFNSSPAKANQAKASNASAARFSPTHGSAIWPAGCSATRSRVAPAANAPRSTLKPPLAPCAKSKSTTARSSNCTAPSFAYAWTTATCGAARPHSGALRCRYASMATTSSARSTTARKLPAKRRRPQK